MISYELSWHVRHPVLMIVGNLNLADHRWQRSRLARVLCPGVLFHFLWPRLRNQPLPFDLRRRRPSCGGYHTEYSSMKFALFFLAEYSTCGVVAMM